MFIETSKNEETGKYEVEIKASNSVNLQQNKNVQVADNGTITINPDEGYDGMKKVTLVTSVLGDSDYVKKVTMNFDFTNGDSYPFNFKIEFKPGHRGETFTLVTGPFDYTEEKDKSNWHTQSTTTKDFVVPDDSDTVVISKYNQLYYSDSRKALKEMYMRIYESNFWSYQGSKHPPFPRSQEFGIEEEFDTTIDNSKEWNFN
jgi:hypothetical protein